MFCLLAWKKKTPKSINSKEVIKSAKSQGDFQGLFFQLYEGVYLT